MHAIGRREKRVDEREGKERSMERKRDREGEGMQEGRAAISSYKEGKTKNHHGRD